MCYQGSKLSGLIELPEVFSSIKKCLLLGALRLGDLLLELRFVSRSSETSRSSGTSQSSISLCPAFPDVAGSMWVGSASLVGTVDGVAELISEDC